MINAHTKLMGLLGHPVGHSVSPALQNALAEHYGINTNYMAFDIISGGLGDFLKGIYGAGAVGFNVTVPYKQEVMKYLSHTDAAALGIGAVNTVKREEDGWHGYNTDMPGLKRAFLYDQVEIKGRNVVILGAGGAANAAVAAAAESGAANILIANRTVDKAEALAKHMGELYPECSIKAAGISTGSLYAAMDGISHDNQWIAIQTTSVGMFPAVEEAAITEEAFYQRLSVGYDIIFNPAETKFMKLAAAAGAGAYNGLRMLVFQGIRSFEIWNGIEVSDAVAEKMLRITKQALGIEEPKQTLEGKRMKLLVINGPNLNFLGIREKAVYGTKNYEDLLAMIAEKAQALNIGIEVFQSNHEGAIIDRIQDAYADGTEGIIINPGAYTHYSYAIRDALASVQMPKIEIHISDINAREEFRKISVTAEVCDEQIKGLGLEGYLVAIDHMTELINKKNIVSE